MAEACGVSGHMRAYMFAPYLTPLSTSMASWSVRPSARSQTCDAKAETAKKRPVVPEDISQQVLKACSKIGAPERALASFPNLRTLSAASLGELMAVDGIGAEKARKIRKVCSEN